MTLVSVPDNTNAQHPDVQLTLSWDEAEHLRVVLPWLLQALAADRPEAVERLRERRRKAHTILERLRTVLSGQLQPAENNPQSQQ